MADTVKFPGTEIDVIEKHPGSRRLDHPNFGDVAKTTFSKGIITEFQRPDVENPDDPIKVEALVKVKVDDEETDNFIPIFFTPKKTYWDNPDEDVLAQDYDEERGCFKQAWQSFRGDDEVKVLMQAEEDGGDLKPRAVIGHLEGGPRIGEDIFKVDTGGGVYFSVQKQDLYKGKEKGPDGLALNLLTECQPIPAGVKTRSYEEKKEGYPVTKSQTTEGGTIGALELIRIDDWYWPGAYVEQYFFKYWWKNTAVFADVWRTLTFTTEDYYYLAIVGPILLWIEASKTTIGNYKYEFRNPGLPLIVGGDSDKFLCMYRRHYPPAWLLPDDIFPECTVEAESMYNNFNYRFHADHNAEEYKWGEVPSTDSARLDAIYAAVYTKELYQRSQESGSLEDRPEEFVLQNTFNFWADEFENLTEIDFSLFVRPHTKEELQEAGLWPEGE